LEKLKGSKQKATTQQISYIKTEDSLCRGRAKMKMQKIKTLFCIVVCHRKVKRLNILKTLSKFLKP
jgi:hypothetical protein